jgi:hypothetical protein
MYSLRSALSIHKNSLDNVHRTPRRTIFQYRFNFGFICATLLGIGHEHGGVVKLDKHKVLRARERLGYGVAKVAEEAGIAKGSALRAEHGEDLRPITARRVARALGVKVADLMPDPSLSTEWATSVSDEAFRQGLKRASVEQLWSLIRELVADKQPRLFEDERDERPSADALYQRGLLFARALIVRQELWERGEGWAEQEILNLHRYVDALALREDPTQSRYQAQLTFAPGEQRDAG